MKTNANKKRKIIITIISLFATLCVALLARDGIGSGNDVLIEKSVDDVGPETIYVEGDDEEDVVTPKDDDYEIFDYKPKELK